MTNHSNSESSIPKIAAIIGVVAIIAVVLVFASVVSAPVSNPSPTPTAIEQTSSPSGNYQPEIIPPQADLPIPTQASTITPTDTPVPTPTLFVLPTLVSNRQLPDLTVTGISDPVCATEYEGTKLRFYIYVRNIGSVRTRSFGPFETTVYLILGQRHYSLDEWATEFNGVIGSSVGDVFNLNPNGDIKFTVVIDLIGNKDFGIEVKVNSGENPIREADMSNNTLKEYYSVYCY